MGIGIEIMTYIADHYRPPDLRAAIGIFGRPNVVRNADFVLVIGDGTGTLDEVDLAVSMGKRESCPSPRAVAPPATRLTGCVPT